MYVVVVGGGGGGGLVATATVIFVCLFVCLLFPLNVDFMTLPGVGRRAQLVIIIINICNNNINT